MTRPTSTLRDAAYRWIADDPDPRTRDELQRVLAAAMGGDAAALADLTDRMSGPLTFGTAGLRGPVRAGPNGMNRAVVRRTSAGLASWLAARGAGGGVVVVGRDARHGSEDFCADAAGVLAAAGFDVRVLPRPLPTPVLAFAVRSLGAVAGVQVTASHNPPADNGYKLYLAGGAQLVPPDDREIEAAIAAVPSRVELSEGWTRLGEDVLDRYLERVASLPRGGSRALRVVATALHGVGAAPLQAALSAAGFTDVTLVPEQSQPDADFPTVAFPNPEEPGATDLLLALAESVSADLAVALDPDADRCALGVPGPDGWRMLSGDEAGVLLGAHVLSTVDAAGPVGGPGPLVANTIVSSSMLRAVAEAAGARYDATLTGFKWLVRAGDGRGTGLVFAYEEALGLCVDPDHVRDKDGISAAVLACDLVASLLARGSSVHAELDALSTRHGVHLTRQLSVRVTDLGRITALMAALRTSPPTRLADVQVAAEDLQPKADVLRYTGGGLRVIVRPSGTEPKVKAYLEVVEPVSGEQDLATAKQAAQDRLERLATEVGALLQ
ncbi:phospho-sugar mutase [Actinokineospora bangkokensis]|uniref:Phosphomannomutase n=1 Tax=Actinokineospora bangkokensis TaxID=1193682 RepID=A0A1Q9LEN1_9PSEU|nr:phospho-sugar mutase [Actinokineospora bangkokensis]OLR90473.1 phosphomannomutase [Actinokineospora bangkokensis]